MRIILAVCLWLGCLCVYAQSKDEKRLEFIKTEQSKLQKMMKAGDEDGQLDSYFKELEAERKSIESKLAKSANKKKEVKKKKPKKVKKKAKKKKKRKAKKKAVKVSKPKSTVSSYKVDKSLSLEKQYAAVLSDLEKEKSLLARLQESYNKSKAGYLLDPIAKAKRKIASIVLAKVEIERQLDATRKTTVKRTGQTNAAKISFPTKSILYKVDKKLSLEDQYSMILTDLDSEQDFLARLQESYDKSGASYLMEPIDKSKRRIANIEREKVKVERKMAEESKTALQVKTGIMLDAYYMYDLNDVAGGKQLSLRNYDKSHNDFTINMAEVNFTGKFRRYGFYVDLDFGEFAEQNTPDSTDPQGHNIGQAFMIYEKNGYLFRFGKMYTNVGYEAVKAQENWNYSRSFAFSNTIPFWHEGLAVEKSYDNGFGWGLYIYDQWDGRRQNNQEQTYSAQLNYTKGPLSLVYNYITGAQNRPVGNKRTVHQAYSQYEVSERLALAFNAVFNTDEGAGINGQDLKKMAFVGYAHYKWRRFAWTPRIELYEEENTTMQAEDKTSLANSTLKFTSFTFTTSYSPRDYTELRLELRHDSADQNYYADDTSLTKTQNTISFSWLMKY